MIRNLVEDRNEMYEVNRALRKIVKDHKAEIEAEMGYPIKSVKYHGDGSATITAATTGLRIQFTIVIPDPVLHSPDVKFILNHK